MRRIKRPKAKLKHKDTVFVDLFGKDRSAEKNFRSLYRALHGMELEDHAQIKSVHI